MSSLNVLEHASSAASAQKPSASRPIKSETAVITETALITGASSGIGMHLAREFARHGHPVVLIAPVPGDLEHVANEIESEFNVRTRALAKDLTRETVPEEIFTELAAEGTRIDSLVNNA